MSSRRGRASGRGRGRGQNIRGTSITGAGFAESPSNLPPPSHPSTAERQDHPSPAVTEGQPHGRGFRREPLASAVTTAAVTTTAAAGVAAAPTRVAPPSVWGSRGRGGRGRGPTAAAVAASKGDGAPSSAKGSALLAPEASDVPAALAPSISETPAGDAFEIEGSGINIDTLKASFLEAFEGKPPEICLRSDSPAAAGAGGAAAAGSPIPLMTNLFPIKLPQGVVYHYDVELTELDGKKLESIPAQKRARSATTVVARKVINTLARQYRKELGDCLPSYDGRKNMYMRSKPFAEQTFHLEVEDCGQMRQFGVKLKFATAVSFDALHAMYDRKATKELFQDAIAAADIIIRTGPSLAYSPVGRSFFDGLEATDLEGGREAWNGFYTSIRTCSWKPLVNIDMSMTAFYKSMPLHEFVRELVGPRAFQAPFSDRDRVALQKDLVGLRVTHTHLNTSRRYRIMGLSRRPASQETFEMDGQRVTVLEYFQRKYNIRLRHPTLPCVVERKGNLYPMEVCILAGGQHCRKKLNESQTRKMVQASALDPDRRLERARQAVSKLLHSAAPYMDEFGMKIDTVPVEVTGRILPPPRISYANSTPIEPRQGVWNSDQPFNVAAPLDNWAIVTHGRLDNLGGAVQTLMAGAQKLGMKPAPPLYSNSFPPHVSERQMLDTVKNNAPKANITVVVLDRNTNYSRLKYEAETTDLSMTTQCIKKFNVERKFNSMFVTNVLTKMNTKMGGRNWSLFNGDRPETLRSPFMVVGADVNHPAPGDTTTPSVAAVVASLDPCPAQYHCVTSVQTNQAGRNRVEYIVDLKQMFLECLQVFRQRAKGILPRIIYFYRDGVSEAQFDAVRYYEMTALRNACLELSPSYKPPMAFIVVQKRHHVRFKPKMASQRSGPKGNIPPGTVVDSHIVSPLYLDFYLCSHQGIIGTSRPAHYHVVHDDAGHSLSELEKISYFFCHTYARCARSVSIPAATYYAHLAASRAKDHIKAGVYDSHSPTASLASSQLGEYALEEFAAAQRVGNSMKSRMYFV